MIRKEKKAIYSIISVAVLLFCEWFFFRNVLFTSNLIGDTGDGRLTTLITEHWYHVLRGEVSITELGMFYPAMNTLAYSDMLLGFGIVHSIIRLFGIDVFLAYSITLIVYHLIGTMGSFYLLHKELNVKHFWAVFGTIAFSFSYTYAACIGHTQLVAISILPIAIIFLARFFRFIRNRKKRNINAYCFILTIVLVLYTAWYIAFFFALFTVITAIIIICLRKYNHKKILPPEYREVLRMIFPDLIGYIIIGMLLVAPFAYLEVSIMKSTNEGGFGLAKEYIPEVIDIVNLSSQNWLFGKIGESLKLSSRVVTSEATSGFSLVVIISFLALFFISVRNRNKPFEGNESRTDIFIIQRAVSWAVIICILLTVQISSNGITFWRVIYSLFPGGKAIRAVGRFFFFLSFPMGMIVAILGNEYTIRVNKKWISLVVMPLLCIALFISNIKTDGVTSFWNKNIADSIVQDIAVPPDDCKVFFLIYDKEEKMGEPFEQLDAYQIADYFHIKTINGYSGVSPKGWNGIWNINDGDYLSAISLWIKTNNLENVYSYSLAENKWELFNPSSLVGEYVFPAKKIIPSIIYDCLDMEPQGEFSWIGENFSITLKDEQITREGLLLRVGAVPEQYKRQQQGVIPEAKLYINGTYIKDLSVTDGIENYQIEVLPDMDNQYTIEIKSNFYFNPSVLGDSSDNRNLSLQLYYLGSPSNYSEST